MAGRMARGVRVAVVTVLGSLAVAPPSSGSPPIDVERLISETQKQTADPNRLTSVWWLPEEFWQSIFSEDETMPEEAVEEILAVVRPYALFGIFDGTLGPLGGATFTDPETLREFIVLVDKHGQRYPPLEPEKISPDARNLAMMMQPLLAGILGPTGESVGFFFFPAVVGDSEPIASATAKGGFRVEVGDQVFEWKTPLGSVLPPKTCPVDREQMSGLWTYCPWHGKELQEIGTE